jgi:hypothetical protein
MGVTRAAVKAYWGEPLDWYWFCGMKKQEEGASHD